MSKVYSLDTLRQLKKEHRVEEYGMIMIETQEDLEVHLANARNYTFVKVNEEEQTELELA